MRSGDGAAAPGEGGAVVSDLSTRGAIIARLEEIERDLAARQGVLENAAMKWFRAKRDREHARAVAFIGADGTVAERNALADRETCRLGAAEEAEWEAVRAVVRVLDTRATVGMALLKAEREEQGPQPSWSRS